MAHHRGKKDDPENPTEYPLFAFVRARRPIWPLCASPVFVHDLILSDSTEDGSFQELPLLILARDPQVRSASS
jgi:hypothetical protein